MHTSTLYAILWLTVGVVPSFALPMSGHRRSARHNARGRYQPKTGPRAYREVYFPLPTLPDRSHAHVLNRERLSAPKEVETPVQLKAGPVYREEHFSLPTLPKADSHQVEAPVRRPVYREEHFPLPTLPKADSPLAHVLKGGRLSAPKEAEIPLSHLNYNNGIHFAPDHWEHDPPVPSGSQTRPTGRPSNVEKKSTVNGS
ncbi:hypothetical protein F5148DRAFT_1251158, partial [Russula earlei]